MGIERNDETLGAAFAVATRYERANVLGTRAEHPRTNPEGVVIVRKANDRAVACSGAFNRLPLHEPAHR